MLGARLLRSVGALQARPSARPAVRAARAPSRSFAAAAGPKGYGDGPYRGVEPHLPGFWHMTAARGLGCMMWLWVFYRCKQDGLAFLGIEHHFEHVDADSLRAELAKYGKGLACYEDEETTEEIIKAVASAHHHH